MAPSSVPQSRPCRWLSQGYDVSMTGQAAYGYQRRPMSVTVVVVQQRWSRACTHRLRLVKTARPNVG
jgi:hypothetical protein